MATKWCLECGSEYIATVEVCPDCGVDLVDQEPVADEPEVDSDPTGKVEYVLDEWAAESRVMLEQLLEGDGVPHAWEATTLVVAAGFETQVDDMVEYVQATTLPTLDPDAEKYVYELDDWTDEQVNRLADALGKVQIPFEFDAEGGLVVLAIDEERVEDLLDSIESPDALAPDMEGESESPDAQAALSDLFVATDRLRKHARSHEGVLGLVEAARVVEQMGVPFGFVPAVWNDIVGQTQRLHDALEQDSETDDEIEAHAAELRDLLRSYV